MEFWQVVKSGMQVAASENGVNLEITGPWVESDIEGQIEIMKQVLKNKPKGIRFIKHMILRPIL